jgi:molybdopterin converting factor small subunit
MRITVKSIFDPNETELDTQSTTLGALFDELSSDNYRLIVAEFFDSEHREIYPYCEVVVNGQTYQALTDGLDTKLKDGDRVEIYVIMPDGG